MELIEQEAELRKKKLARKRQNATKNKKKREQLKIKNNSTIRAVAKQYADKLVKNATSAEKQLYRILKSVGIDFKFQHPIYNKDKNGNIKQFYIADFYLPKSNTIVEVDGGYHFSEEQQKKDASRTWNIKNAHKGIKILRINNGTVLNGIKIMKFLRGIQDRESALQEKNV